MRGLHAVILLSLAMALPIQAGEPQRPGDLRATSDSQVVRVFEGDNEVLRFQHAPKALLGRARRSHYIHPLFGLQGQVLTEDFPVDHRHHRGIFTAWHQVTVGDTACGDAWMCRDFDWDVTSTTVLAGKTDGRQNVTIRAHASWSSPNLIDTDGDPVPLATETTTIRIHASGDGERLIEYDSKISAQVDELRLGGSEDAKGYGGFSWRLKLQGNEVFSTEHGELEPTMLSLPGTSALGIHSASPSTSIPWGVVVVQSPTHPGYPHGWLLRRRRSMQNAVYPGRQPVTVKQGHPLQLSYRIIVHDGTKSVDDITKRYAFTDPAVP